MDEVNTDINKVAKIDEELADITQVLSHRFKSSKKTLNNLELLLVWEDDPVVETFDDRFYFAKDVERKLADENAVDLDGNAINDPMTGKQMVKLGLKSVWVTKTKQTANGLLSKSDWEVTRKAEKGTAIASATTTYRDKVRTACDTIETKINDCSSLADFIKLFDVPVDSDGNPTGNAPIYDFPNEA